MKPTVYIDVLFLTNYMADFFLLYMTKAICKSKAYLWRLMCGACIGSIYAVLMFFPYLSFLYSIIAKLIISALIVFISFRIKNFREFLSIYSVFYLSGFILAGISFALFFCTDFGERVGVAMSNGIFYININFYFLALGAIICYACLFLFEKIYVKRLNAQANMHKVRIFYKQKTACVRALLDTANAVSDPITNMPVIVCTMSAVKPLFKEESFYKKLCEIEKTHSDRLKVELVCDTPFRLVPYRALGNAGDVMLGFVPTKLEIDEKVYDGEAIVAISTTPISQSSNYDALLHPRIAVKI